MWPTFVRWTLLVGLGSILLLALPVLPSVMTDASIVSAAEKAEPLDLDTATPIVNKATLITSACNTTRLSAVR